MWELMITKRNKEKRRSQMTLPLFFIVLMATFLTFFQSVLVVVSQSVLVVVSQSVLVVESVFDVAEPQASVDIAVVFVVLVPVSVAVVEVDSSGRPKFLVFPNVGFFASYSSSVELVGEVFVDNPTDVRTNYGICSILSNLGLHQNKNLEWCCNNPSPCYNNVSDTNALPKNATKSHSRKRSLHQCQGQRKHTP